MTLNLATIALVLLSSTVAMAEISTMTDTRAPPSRVLVEECVYNDPRLADDDDGGLYNYGDVINTDFQTANLDLDSCVYSNVTADRLITANFYECTSDYRSHCEDSRWSILDMKANLGCIQNTNGNFDDVTLEMSNIPMCLQDVNCEMIDIGEALEYFIGEKALASLEEKFEMVCDFSANLNTSPAQTLNKGSFHLIFVFIWGAVIGIFI